MTQAYTLSEAVNIADDPISLMEIVKRTAETSLKHARKDGDTLVGRTFNGTLTVCYENKVYTISNFDAELYRGKKAGAVKTLMNSFQIML